jgi:acetamidase/formamidase
MPFERINPVTGPIHVEGATPGDILKITLNDFIPSGFGWTANIFLASASPQVGVIDLDTPGEPLSLVALVHDLQQLVLELPGDVARTDLTSLGVDPYVHDVVTRMHFNVSCRH